MGHTQDHDEDQPSARHPEISPEITQEMRSNARSHPNSWLHIIDPEYQHLRDVPDWAVVGSYPVDEHGEIDTEFRPNEDYHAPPPESESVGQPAGQATPGPPNRLEELLARVHEGQRPQSELPAAVLDAALLVYARSDGDPHLLGFPDRRSGRLVVPACTSARHVPQQWPMWREIRGSVLASLLGDYALVLNPHGPITAVVPAKALVATHVVPVR